MSMLKTKKNREVFPSTRFHSLLEAVTVKMRE